MDYVAILVPVVDTNPHLSQVSKEKHSPHHVANLAESAQAREDTSTNPGRVLSFWGSEDLDPHVLDSQPLHLVK